MNDDDLIAHLAERLDYAALLRIRKVLAAGESRERAVHAALRAHAVGDGICHECDGKWNNGEPEQHAPGCLAAP